MEKISNLFKKLKRPEKLEVPLETKFEISVEARGVTVGGNPHKETVTFTLEELIKGEIVSGLDNYFARVRKI